jgi:ATP-binding cassette, subfamily C, bacterial CydD
MGGDLLRRIPPARPYLVATVVVGLLVAFVTVAQMVFLSEIVDRVFLNRGGREPALTLLSLLLGAGVLRAGLLWVRETTAQQGAVRVKNDHRERLFAHVLQLGPASGCSYAITVVLTSRVILSKLGHTSDTN